MSILPKELQSELLAESLARAERKLKCARSDYMIDYWTERVASLKAAQQSFVADASPDRPLEEHEFNAWDDDPGLY